MQAVQTQLFNRLDLKEKTLVFSMRIIPPEPILSRVWGIKKEFIKLYGKHLLSTSKPYITVASFIMSSSYKNFLIESMNSLKNSGKFKLTTNGIGLFENGKTLVAQIKQSEKFESLLNDIKNLKRVRLNHKAKRFNLSHNPHITISSFLDQETLYSSYNYFSNAITQETFTVDSLIITARENGKTWDWSHQIKF